VRNFQKATAPIFALFSFGHRHPVLSRES
jgi:hypothetical protein